MNRFLRTAGWVVLFSGCVACQGDAPKSSNVPDKQPRLATVVALPPAGQAKTSVEVLRKGKTEWTKEGETVSVFAGDKVRTAGNDVVVVRMASGSEIALNGDTVLEIAASALVNLDKGELWLNAKAPLTVKTVQGSAIAKNGMGTLRFGDGTLSLSWVSGSARLEGKGGSLVLTAGEEATVDASGARQTYIKDPASLLAWTDRVRRAVSPATADDGSLIRPAVLTGLGTLSAKVPGSSKPLPFHILAEDVQVRIQDNMAVTRVEQVFRNPTSQVVEAEYRFPIPENAVLTGYDMEINGRMVKGEIVERERGRKILKKVIDEYLWRIRDPALTEWESGSTFKTRIFPVKPREQKRIVLSHLMPLPGAGGEYRYVLPVAMGATDSPTIPKFRIQATVAASTGVPKVTVPIYAARLTPEDRAVRVDFAADAWKPLVDFAMTIRAPADKDATLATFGRGAAGAGPAGASIALTDVDTFVRAVEDDTFLLRLSPSFAGRATTAAGADWLFLVDTSESRFGPDMEVQKAMVATLTDALGPDDRVKVMAFDTFPVPMDPAWAPPTPALKQRSKEFLSRIQPRGATNLGDALRAARREADAARPMKVLVLGDGAATLGETKPAALADLAGRLFDHPHSVSALAIGSSVDRLLLASLTKRTHGRYFSISAGEDLFTAALRVVLGLRAPVLESPKLSFEGVTVKQALPADLPNLASGQDLLVAGRYQGAGKLVATLAGTVGGKPWSKQWSFDVGQARAGNTFVPLVYAAHKLEALALDGSQAARRETIALSKKYGIATRLTSFIVLENEAMYREFKVERSERVAWSGDGEIDYESQSDSFEDGAVLAKDDDGAAAGEAPGTIRAAQPSGAGPPLARKPAAVGKAASAPSPAAPPSPSRARSADSEAMVAREPTRAEIPRPPEAKKSKVLLADRPVPPYPPYRYMPRPRWQVTVRQLAAAPSPAALARARDLEAAVRAAPMDRRARRNLVAALLSCALLDEAARALSEWAALDRSNPEVHLFAGDLLKLQGDIEGALRAYSSVLDLRPESPRVLGSLADYYEARDRWQAAHPFRISLATIKVKDASAKVDLAVTALRAGRTDDAVRVAAELTEPDSSGYPKLRRGVRLSKAARDTVLSIGSRRDLPLLYTSSPGADLKSAGLRVTLTCDRPASLDLWMSSSRDKYVGGALGKARLLSSASGKERVFFVGGSAKGRYRAQILCADGSGCDHVSGRLVVESHGTRRTLPFVLQGAKGRDLAVIRIEEQRFRRGIR
ncbi:MAG: VWA domain-containing protein [Deltaproteobacteria bacterium]|nr:VWA domain-containing protein [Deltaproteobacteria bacterium]